MTVAHDSSGLDATPWGKSATRREATPLQRLFLFIAWTVVWISIAFYTWKVVGIGLDVRSGFWAFWSQHRMSGDASNGLAWGNRTLRLSEGLEKSDPRYKSPVATIASPGPGLFDSPLNVHNFKERWRRLRPLYQQVFRGWVDIYGRFVDIQQDENLGLDYPPLRLLTITLWTWHSQSIYPGLNFYADMPQPWPNAKTGKTDVITGDTIMPPMLAMNTIIEGLGAIAAFVLAWAWERRRFGRIWAKPSRNQRSWKSRWGNPLLLIPPALLGIFLLLRPWVSWLSESTQYAQSSALDELVNDPAFWISLVLHFTAAVSLARFLPAPFRAPMCGLIAGTLAWLNPPMLIIGHGWPQWDVWMPPFFLMACACAALDWWLCAGIVIGVGSMFKGQILFAAPVLLFSPLIAGRAHQCLKIVAGLACAFGICAGPWLLYNKSAQSYVVGAFFAAAAVCILSIPRQAIFRRLRTPGGGQIAIILALVAAMIPVAGLLLWIFRQAPPGPRIGICILCAGVVSLPWILPRRYITGWLATALASSIFLAGFALQGKFSWWKIGFYYGTKKHQVMQMGRDSLSNLSSLLEKKFGYGLHDVLMTLHIPWHGDVDVDVRQAMAGLFFITIVACTIGAGRHLRRNDPRFLVALTAPWVLFLTLLPQLAARYAFYPAVVGACLVAVSTTVSLLQLLMTILASVMIVNQILAADPTVAPATYAITRQTHPGLGWAMLLLSAVFVYLAVTPSRHRSWDLLKS